MADSDQMKAEVVRNAKNAYEVHEMKASVLGVVIALVIRQTRVEGALLGGVRVLFGVEVVL